MVAFAFIDQRVYYNSKGCKYTVHLPNTVKLIPSKVLQTNLVAHIVELILLLKA